MEGSDDLPKAKKGRFLAEGESDFASRLRVSFARGESSFLDHIQLLVTPVTSKYPDRLFLEYFLKTWFFQVNIPPVLVVGRHHTLKTRVFGVGGSLHLTFRSPLDPKYEGVP